MSTEDTTKDKYIIDTKSVQNSFEQELKQYGDSSARIFFSGKYGVGKTKFLERFFEEKKEEYLTVHLYPVNYQISTNEDIINLLKYDILVELFEKYEGFFKINNIQSIQDNILLFYVWINYFISPKNSNLILQTPLDILETIPEIGKLGRPLKSLLDINKEFQQFKSIYEKGEKGLAEGYLSKIKPDDITETDIISQLIKDKIQEIKGEKKSVLIIDDLDRLDPEHIFRILNILSAHFDQDGDNKFGFDYIIIVGDYHNIQSIFHHKYGKDTDFDGYIDKFYTVKPFEFDNRKALLANLGTILEKYQREDSPKDNLDYSYFIIEDIIQKTISLDIINLRKLLKHIKIKLLPAINKISNIPIESSHLYISIDILLDIFETKDSLIGRIQKIKENKTLSNTYYFTDKCKKISYKLYEAIIGKSITDDTIYEYIYKSTKYNLISDGDDCITIKQGNPEQDINLYYDLLMDFITNKFDKL